MNEFIEQVRHVRIDKTRRKIAIPGRLTSVSIDFEEDADPPRLATKHRIEIVVGATIYLQEKQESDRASQRVQNQITECVYGEVRAIVNSLWADVYGLREKDWELSERIAEKLGRIIEGTQP